MYIYMPNMDLDFASIRSLEVRPAMHSCILRYPEDGFRASSETVQTQSLSFCLPKVKEFMCSISFSVPDRSSQLQGRGRGDKKKQPNPQRFIKLLEQVQQIQNYKIKLVIARVLTNLVLHQRKRIQNRKKRIETKAARVQQREKLVLQVRMGVKLQFLQSWSSSSTVV